MTIKKISEKDILQICKLHYQAFDKSHFTSVLPVKLIAKYYYLILKYNNYCFMVYEDDSNYILGFVLGGNKTTKAINEFIKNNYLHILLSFIKHPKFIFEKLKDIFMKIFKGADNPSKAKYRLLSIAVDTTSQRSGIGKTLLNTFENELLKNKIYLYGLSVREKNKKAINFYLKNGFEKELKSSGNIYFLKKLKN